MIAHPRAEVVGQLLSRGTRVRSTSAAGEEPVSVSFGSQRSMVTLGPAEVSAWRRGENGWTDVVLRGDP